MTEPKQVKFEKTTDENAEKAEALVCIRTGGNVYFDDDLFGNCSVCGHEVRFRPHAPKAIRKLCLQCVLNKPWPIDVIATETSLREAADYFIEHPDDP